MPKIEPWDKGFDAGFADAGDGIAKPRIWLWGHRAARCGVIKRSDFFEWRDGYDEGYACGSMEDHGSDNGATP